MDNFWIGRFVRITNQYNDNFHERGQVVDHHAGVLTIRYATGKHAASSTQGVCMDPDQTTPVWPPTPTPMADGPIRVGDFVNVMRPDSGGTTRGRVTSQTVCAAYHVVDVVYADGSTGALRWDQVTLSTDQTTPLDGGA